MVQTDRQYKMADIIFFPENKSKTVYSKTVHIFKYTKCHILLLENMYSHHAKSIKSAPPPPLEIFPPWISIFQYWLPRLNLVGYFGD